MSTQTVDEQISMDILRLLYKTQNDRPNYSSLDRAIIQDVLKLSNDQLEKNVTFLKEKELISLVSGANSKWIFAKISPGGIAFFENNQLPIESTPNSEPVEGVDLFRHARDQVRQANINDSDKNKIEKQLRALEFELKKEKNDLTKIQKICKELDKIGYKVSPEVSCAILEAIKKELKI